MFTFLLRISVHNNRESSDVALVRISEKVKQSDNFVYAITTKYVSLPLTLISLTITSPNSLEPLYTLSFTNYDSYLQQYAENWISNCKIFTRHTNTNPNSQFHIPVVQNNSDFKLVIQKNNGAKCSRRLHRCSLVLSIGTRLSVSAYSRAYRKRFAFECALCMIGHYQSGSRGVNCKSYTRIC